MAKAKRARKSAKRAKMSPARKKAARNRTVRKRAAKPRRKAAKRKPGGRKRAAAKGSELLTLTEVSKRTGISMPTLQRYKKEHQRRLATVGKGRSQRYKPESIAVFKQIKKENLKKRGRPRKLGARGARKRARGTRGATPEGLISLSEIGRRTGISYPTLLRYVRLYGDRIPSHGTGRKRRFPEEAVPVFRELRQQSRRGRRRGSAARRQPAAAAGRGLSARLRALERRQAKLDKQLRALLRALKRPIVKKL